MRVAFVLDPLSGNEMVRVYSRDGAARPTNAPIPRCAPEAPPENVEPSAPGTELTPTEVSAGEKDIRHTGDDAMALEDEVDSAEIAAAVAGPTEQSWAGGAAAGATVAAASGCKEPTGSAREDSSKIRSSPPTHPPPVVFIHGIMGSTLEDGSGSTQFLTVPHVLGLHSPSLALPTNWHVHCSITCRSFHSVSATTVFYRSEQVCHSAGHRGDHSTGILTRITF